MNSISNKIKLFIIDDHKIVINGIKLALQDQLDIELVGFSTTAQSAKERLDKIPVDVILQDIQLPDEDGIDLTKYIKGKFPNIKIIGLTTYTEVSFIAELMRLGANGYLFKDTSEEELIRAIKEVYLGKQYLSEEVNKKLLAQVIRKRGHRKSFIPKLTRREKEVLTLVVAEHTNQEIADKLFLSVSTVEKHRINLGIKLEARNAVGLYKQALKFGLL